MDSKQNFEKTTPSKNIFKTVHGRLAHSTFNSESPFKRLPNFSTPPSRFVKIKNPFETHLAERLHTHFFSPSVFQVSSPKTEEKFMWTIDEISSFQPADIDDVELEQYESPEHDSMMESCAQAKIDQFFSKGVVPSPYNQELKTQPLIPESYTPYKVQHTYCDSAVQTLLSLPPQLPEHVEMVLKPYFSYVDKQHQSDTNDNTSLYRKLFEFEEHDNESLHSIQSSPPHSLHLSPIAPLPNSLNNVDVGVKCGSPTKLNECNLSPIAANSSYSFRERKSATRLNFSGYMSIDNSLNIVPDAYNQMPKNEITNFDSSNSPVPEVLSDSTINWDMEYKQITSQTPNKFEKQMEISNSYTPKSKIFMSQRKKLSDSFLREETFDYKENMRYIPVCTEGSIVTRQECLYVRQQDSDAGYHTGVHTVSDDSLPCNSSNLFASTPTKK